MKTNYNISKTISLATVKSLIPVICLCWLTMLQSCVTPQVGFTNHQPLIDTLGMNGIVVFYNPVFETKMNGMGALAVVGMAVAGGVAAANSDESDNTAYNVARTLHGAAEGAVVTRDIIRSQEEVRYVTPGSVSEWIEDYNSRFRTEDMEIYRKYKYVSHTMYDDGTVASITVIDNKFDEKYFKIKTEEDAKLYVSLFPNREHCAEVLYGSLGCIQRNDLHKIIYILGDGPATYSAKLHYLETAKTLDEVISATTRYPELKDNAEARATQIVATENKKYKKTFPNAQSILFINE